MKTSNLRRASLVLLFSVFIGLASGLVATIFGQVLLKIEEVRQQHFFYLIPFLALAGLLIIFLYKKWGKEAQRGMTLVFEVGHAGQEKIPKRLVPLVIVSTWLTHLFGGSAGREGVAIQIGATIAHHFENLFPEKKAGNLFLLIGFAAGFAGLFQTPLAASFFAIEVLIVGHYFWSALAPTLVAAYTASATSHLLGLEKFQHELTANLNLSPVLILHLLVLGIVFAALGNSFAILLKKTRYYLSKKLPNPYFRIAIVGLVLSLAMIFLQEGRYAGLGINLIEASLDGHAVYSYDWLFKLLLTVLTLAAGFQGGEVTPLFSIGASAGVVLAGILGLPFEIAAALGYIAVFGSATNTLLAPILIGIEVFGWHHAPAYIIVVSVAHFLNRKDSIYEAQKV